MIQTMVSPEPLIDSSGQYHDYKVIWVKSVYIETYHIGNIRSKFCMTDVTVNRLCVQEFKQQKLEVVLFTEPKVPLLYINIHG
jgi:hypothetical protein